MLDPTVSSRQRRDPCLPDLHESVYVDALELLHSSVGPTDAEFVDTSDITQAEMNSHVVVG